MILFYIFLGCKYHPGCCIPDHAIENAETKRNVWRNKKFFMKSQGVLIEMRECEWRVFLKNHRDYPETKIHNLLLRDNEQSLLEAIQSDKVFGFLGNLFYYKLFA